MLSLLRIGAAVVFTVATALAAAPKLVVLNEHPDGVYKVGEPITWNITVSGEGADQVKTLLYELKKNGMVSVGKGQVDVKDGKATISLKGMEEPGYMMNRISGAAGTEAIVNVTGAVVAPETFQAALPRPADFDAFWKDKLAELAKAPMNPQVEPVASTNPNVESFKITLDNINGGKIHALLMRPKTGEKFPGMVVVQWAGVYGLQPGWNEWRAAEGWLILNVMPHDLPYDEKPEFYKDQAAGPLKDYSKKGRDNRDKSYFLAMFLGAVRASDYLASRPDWNGKVLVAAGASQGGYQSIMLAGLQPKITAVTALIPAGCDHGAPLQQRAPSWPMWLNNPVAPETAESIAEASKYYDAVNFASLIKVPTLVGAGLLDTTCPIRNVYSMINQLQGPKEVIILPLSEHKEVDHSQKAYGDRQNVWLKTLAKGEAVPPAK